MQWAGWGTTHSLPQLMGPATPCTQTAAKVRHQLRKEWKEQSGTRKIQTNFESGDFLSVYNLFFFPLFQFVKLQGKKMHPKPSCNLVYLDGLDELGGLFQNK